VLHSERLLPRRIKRTHPAQMGDLPDGVMIALGDIPWLVLGDELLEWTPFGYGPRTQRRSSGEVTLLTPLSTVAAIRAGYAPAVHPTATAGAPGTQR
jgi:hypothetical protein